MDKYYLKDLENKYKCKKTTEEEFLKELPMSAVLYTSKETRNEYIKKTRQYIIGKYSMAYARGFSPIHIYIDKNIFPLSKKQFDGMLSSCVVALYKTNENEEDWFKIIDFKKG